MASPGISNVLSFIAFLNAIFAAQAAIGQTGVDRTSLPNSGFTYTSYQQGMTCYASQKPLKPTTLENLQGYVRDALKNNHTLKALGSRHSVTDIICTDGIPISMLRINHFRYDHQTGFATVGAGISGLNFTEQLHKHGRTIHGLPSYADATIGGILGTGAHGSNLRNPATISDQVVSFVIIDGEGNVRNITDHETVRALKVNLGLLGIIYEVVIRTVPQFKLHVRNYPQSDSLLWRDNNEIIKLATSNDHFHFWWFPTSREVVLSLGDIVPMDTPGNCQTYLISELSAGMARGFASAIETMQEGMDHLGLYFIQGFTKLSLHQQVTGKSPIYTEDGKTLCTPAVGFSHRMISNRCNECAWNHGNDSLLELDYEIIIPLSELQGALNTMRSILQEYPMEFPLNGIFFRFLSASDALLAFNSERISVVIEWILVPRNDRFEEGILGLSTSQALQQALVDKHKGRPHWGKNGLHYTNPQLMRQLYEHIPTFIKQMEEIDPHGVFLNDFGRRLRYGSYQFTTDPRVKHCALLDHCLCSSDWDCGNGSGTSYKCSELHGYRVCRENPGNYDAEKSAIVRDFVSILGGK